ncbi:MAG TPA: FKBP-type peptidyl-prolyl cis-trans isomerase [Pirellulales bacterium]
MFVRTAIQEFRDRVVPGIRVIAESEGAGPAAERGDLVEFDSQGCLSRGERIQELMSYATQLGSRRIIAGIEYALIGMKVGGYRKVKISPHLGYRDQGVVGKIPPKAVLVYELWLTKVEKSSPHKDS